MYSLEQLAPYFPYRLKFVDTESSNIYEAMSMYDDSIGLYSESMPTEPFYLDGRTGYFKPLLLPLSGYEKTFNDYLSCYWSDFNYFCQCISDRSLDYSSMINLIEKHFDVFGLIDKGLAIDINTLPCKS